MPQQFLGFLALLGAFFNLRCFPAECRPRTPPIGASGACAGGTRGEGGGPRPLGEYAKLFLPPLRPLAEDVYSANGRFGGVIRAQYAWIGVDLVFLIITEGEVEAGFAQYALTCEFG